MLSQLLPALTSNPGAFSYDSDPSGPIFTIAMGFLFVLFAVLLSMTASTKKEISVVVACVLIGAVGIITGASWSVNMDSAEESASHAYEDSVVDWLEEGYGIEADRAAASQLIDGDELVATVNGHDQLITIVESTSGDLRVLDDGQKVVRPVNAR